MKKGRQILWLSVIIVSIFMCNLFGGGTETILLWEKGSPGEPAITEEEKDITKPSDPLIGGRRIIRLGNVTKPSLTIYRPEIPGTNGVAVVIFPGGGYHILAMDLEGTEVAEWLNSIGVTAIVVKYRVPARKGQERYLAPLQDAQRAMRIVRNRAQQLGINPDRIGVLGFSAGAHLCAVLSAQYDKPAYELSEEIDKLSCKPNFQLLLYPAYLTLQKEGDAIAPEVSVSKNTPLTFIMQTQDDPIRVETSIYYYLALKKAGVPSELHIFPSGGHGYGLRPGKRAAVEWTRLAEGWLKELFK